jgi:uncharacterized membrane protein YphA (DoxX/SURF4 family)
MKMNEPIGDAAFGPLLVRLQLGAYFLMAGLAKLDQLAAFILEIKRFGILPENIASLYGSLLPYTEAFVGGALMLGLWTTLASSLSSIILLSIIIAYGAFPHIPGGTGTDVTIFNKDIVLLGMSLSLLFTGCGKYGVDNVKK